MSHRDYRNFKIGALALAALLLVAGLGQGAPDEKKEDKAKGGETSVTFSGMTVGIDADTGRLRPLSADEARELREILLQRFGSRQGTTRIEQRDGGMISAVVGMEHLNFSVVHRGADGSLATDCLQTTEAPASSPATSDEAKKDR